MRNSLIMPALRDRSVGPLTVALWFASGKGCTPALDPLILLLNDNDSNHSSLS
jgi:hypothetical protein